MSARSTSKVDSHGLMAALVWPDLIEVDGCILLKDRYTEPDEYGPTISFHQARGCACCGPLA